MRYANIDQFLDDAPDSEIKELMSVVELWKHMDGSGPLHILFDGNVDWDSLAFCRDRVQDPKRKVSRAKKAGELEFLNKLDLMSEQHREFAYELYCNPFLA